jgi:hypothetical protein
MAQEIPPAEMERFSKKLEDWSKSLSDNERTLFKYMLDLKRDDQGLGPALQSERKQGHLSEGELAQVSGGAYLTSYFSGLTVQSYAPTLSARYFQLRCW